RRVGRRQRLLLRLLRLGGLDRFVLLLFGLRRQRRRQQRERQQHTAGPSQHGNRTPFFGQPHTAESSKINATSIFLLLFVWNLHAARNKRRIALARNRSVTFEIS